jgi:hypothetical protein
MKITSKILFIGLIAGVMATSCTKKTCLNNVPELEYYQFNRSPVDSVHYLLIFNFKDCDGDIGMDATSTIKDEFGEEQSFNFFIDLYHVVNNEWVKHEFGNSAGLNYKIPILSNSNVDPSLDGELERKLHPVTALLGYDSVMFKSRILDNAGHYSNEVETPGFIIDN